MTEKIKVRYHESWFGYNYEMPGMHPQQNTRVDLCNDFEKFKKEVSERNGVNINELEFIRDIILLM